MTDHATYKLRKERTRKQHVTIIRDDDRGFPQKHHITVRVLNPRPAAPPKLEFSSKEKAANTNARRRLNLSAHPGRTFRQSRHAERMFRQERAAHLRKQGILN